MTDRKGLHINNREPMKSRLEYLDLTKGICMLMLIFSHIGVLPDHYILYYFYFPVFLVISGFFFPKNLNIIQFIKNRGLKILVPFLFFYLVSYLLFYLGMIAFPEYMHTDAKGISDIFVQRQWFNGPIWYLLCLFWVNIWLYIVDLIDRTWIQILAVLSLGYLGAFFGKNYIFMPMMIDSSLSSLPFFYLGYMLKSSIILYVNKYDKYSIVIGSFCLIVTMILAWIFPYNWVGFHTNTIVGNYFLSIVISAFAVFAVLFLCKSIKTLPFIAFFGMYSIIPFSVHHLIYRPLIVFFDHINICNSLFIVAIVTIIISSLMIPLFKKYLPWVIGIKNK